MLPNYSGNSGLPAPGAESGRGQERVRVASKSAGSAATLGTASSAQLASDASLPHSPDGFSPGGCAHLIVLIDSLTQEAATPRLGEACWVCI